jgi:hypothetical protein
MALLVGIQSVERSRAVQRDSISNAAMRKQSIVELARREFPDESVEHEWARTGFYIGARQKGFPKAEFDALK